MKHTPPHPPTGHICTVIGTLSFVFLFFGVATAAAAEFQFGSETITVPDGFVVEQVAGPPLVDRPITADFDERGRLYAADSSGSNEPVQVQLEKKPHRIVRLEDTDQDGAFDTSIVFADRMMFPEGTLWHQGSLYVSAPPAIWKLTDTDDDGVADRREEWVNPGTLTGCANDLHGPYLGLDGWIYWCKGAFAKQEYPRHDGGLFTTRAAHIFRRRPDGGFVEPVMTGGMDNPVEVAFTPGGERIFSTTFLQHPAGGRRDGLIHAVYGGVYGKRHNVIDEHPRTGDVMPVMTHLGPAAACALIRFESDSFGNDYRDNLFSSSFNLNKVSRHVLEPDGATFRSVDSDFLVSDNPDFHVTHLVEDADGSLLVINTGGWYKICCPTSQLYKPDVYGAIYRVRRRDAVPVKDPRGLQLDWDQISANDLAARLEDPRPAVRARAIASLGRIGRAAVAPLRAALDRTQPVSPGARAASVWALTRIDHQDARAAVWPALVDSDVTVRQAAAHSSGLWRDSGAAPRLTRLLRPGAPAHNRRAAAEALGRIGDSSAVAALLSSAAEPVDRVLEHSLIYALIEINDPDRTRAGLLSKNPRVQRVAAMALDQMPAGDLTPADVVPMLASAESVLTETANWIVNRRPEWGDAFADYFQEALGADDAGPAPLADPLAAMSGSDRIQSLLARTVVSPQSASWARATALEAMARSPVKNPPESWKGSAASVLRSGDGDLVRAAVNAARKWNGSPGKSAETDGITDADARLSSALRALAADSKSDSDVRLNALAAIPKRDLGSGMDAEFAFLVERLKPDYPLSQRIGAARILASSGWSRLQRTRMIEEVRRVGPLELTTLLPAFARSGDEAFLEVLTVLPGSTGFAGLQPDTIQSLAADRGPAVRRRAAELVATLNLDLEQQRDHIDGLLKELDEGDVRRGQALFNSPKTACSACHAIGYLGGRIGPDLTRIGQVRGDRDLLEAIVYPNASFVRSYEPFTVITDDGEEYNGILTSDTDEGIVLLTGPDAEQRIDRHAIAEMRPGKTSVMPSGMDQALSRQELSDLLAFLRATKW